MLKTGRAVRKGGWGDSLLPSPPPFLLYIHLYDVYKEKRKWGKGAEGNLQK